jgi:hypothetical protein
MSEKAPTRWKIAYVGEETWRVASEPGPDNPPPEVQQIERDETAALRVGYTITPWCRSIEVCDPDEIVIGPWTIPIVKCRWVVVCGIEFESGADDEPWSRS